MITVPGTRGTRAKPRPEVKPEFLAMAQALHQQQYEQATAQAMKTDGTSPLSQPA